MIIGLVINCYWIRKTALQKLSDACAGMNGRLKIMNYKLVIAEKPSVAQSLAAVISCNRLVGQVSGG